MSLGVTPSKAPAPGPLNQQALAALDRAVEQYRTSLLAEAQRLEAGLNTSGGAPEITSSMVQDADLLLRHGYRRPPKSKILLVSQVIAAVGGFTTGVFADAEKLKDPATLALFIGLVAVTIVATVVAFVRE